MTPSSAASSGSSEATTSPLGAPELDLNLDLDFSQFGFDMGGTGQSKMAGTPNGIRPPQRRPSHPGGGGGGGGGNSAGVSNTTTPVSTISAAGGVTAIDAVGPIRKGHNVPSGANLSGLSLS